MKYSQILMAAAMATVVRAHATLWSVSVNDVDQGNGKDVYIRSPPDNSPLKDLTSTDLRCNVGGGSAAPKTITAAAGSKITFQWWHNGPGDQDDIIDGSHQGPVLVYIAPAASNGAGSSWVKLAEDGYSSGKWAVQRLIDARGKHSVTLPASLADGDYLLRPEIIAHHESDTAYSANPARGAQLYMACVQIKVTGGGASSLPAGVAIPGVYTYSDPGIVFNLYASYSSYPIPGPAVWKPSGGSSPAPTTTLRTTTRPVVVPTTTSKAPVVVPTTTSKAPVVVPTTTSKAPVVVPTTSKAPVVPTTTKAPAPVTTSKAPTVPTTTSSKKAACPTPPTKIITVVKPSATPAGATQVKWGQCGGIGYSGPKNCVAGTKCVFSNNWYSQCL